MILLRWRTEVRVKTLSKSVLPFGSIQDALTSDGVMEQMCSWNQGKRCFWHSTLQMPQPQKQHMAGFKLQWSEVWHENIRSGGGFRCQNRCSWDAMQCSLWYPAAMPGKRGTPAGLISYLTSLWKDPCTPWVSQTVPDTSLGDWIQPYVSYFGFFLSHLSGVTSSASPTEPLSNVHHGKKWPNQKCQIWRRPMEILGIPNPFLEPMQSSASSHPWC